MADRPATPGSDTRVPLRVALLLDSLRQPAWVHRAVSDVHRSGIAEIAVVVLPAGAAMEQGGGSEGHVRNGTGLLFDMYRRFDVYWFKDDRPDPFTETDLSALLSETPSIAVPAGGAGAADDSVTRAIDQLSRYDLDVAIRFGVGAPLRGAAGFTRFGVWAYGDASAENAIEPGFREALSGNPVTRSALLVEATPSSPSRVIYESFASTAVLSAWKNRRELYWKTSAFVLRKLRELAEFGPASLAPASMTATPTAAQATVPGNLAMLGYLPRIAARYASTQVAMRTSFDQWFIAYHFRKPGEQADVPHHNLSEFTRLMPPKDRMWADPFPMVHEGQHLIFVEELLFARNKGHISVMELDAMGAPTRPELVLETENHLSYPFVLQWKGETFMVPESARAGDNPADQGSRSVPVFRARRFPHDWVQDTVMLEGLEVFDPTIAEIDGTWWLFCTQAEPGASTWDELHLFHGPSPFGPWTAHRRNPVKSDVRSSRPAGRPYRHNGAWYRPAQNCSVRYGYALSINRIDRLTTSEYRETEVMRILPDWTPGLIGTHTLNAAGGLTVTDGRMRRRKSSPEAPPLPARTPTRQDAKP